LADEILLGGLHYAYQRRLGEETICKIDCIESSDAPWIYAQRDDSQKQVA
jgi:hypothetical protein